MSIHEWYESLSRGFQIGLLKAYQEETGDYITGVGWLSPKFQIWLNYEYTRAMDLKFRRQ